MKAGLLVLRSLCVRLYSGLLNSDVFKFFRIKDFATLQALDKLNVVVPGDDSHLRVFAHGGHRDEFRWNGCSFRRL